MFCFVFYKVTAWICYEMAMMFPFYLFLKIGFSSIMQLNTCLGFYWGWAYKQFHVVSVFWKYLMTIVCSFHTILLWKDIWFDTWELWKFDPKTSASCPTDIADTAWSWNTVKYQKIPITLYACGSSFP